MLTKDAEIKGLEAQVRREVGTPDESPSQAQIEELNKLLLEKQNIIEELQRKFKESGYDESRYTKEDLKLRAFKKVEHINLQIEKRLE